MELDEDFQVVFVARGGQGHLSDIAIDDVRLLTGRDCQQLNANTNVKPSVEEKDVMTDENSETETGKWWGG